MENTLDGAASAPSNEPAAVQSAQSAASNLKLALIWLAVGAPMLWGMLKALEDVPALISLFP